MTHMASELTPSGFVAKWSRVTLSERAASQEHFLDLCGMLGQPTPAGHDATGAEYTFEKGVAVSGPASRGARGEWGFADVWWRGKFAWEYKRKGKYRDLDEAYRQLCQYREALENPPLLIVSDIARTEIHTNFTGTAKQIHIIELERLAEAEPLDLLRRVFTDPASFKPDITSETVTEEIARKFGNLAQGLRDRGHDPHVAAHFLMKCMFCLFAEDVGLLPHNLFERLLGNRRSTPERLTQDLTALFATMRSGGSFGVEDIANFNGGLFDDAPALDLMIGEVDLMLTAAKQDWASVEPAIFGTLFERSLDPNTRAQIGAHYTSREDIMLVVEPVVMAPLCREWKDVQARVEAQLKRRAKAKTKDTRKKADRATAKLLQDFVERLATIRILDPACGSGNFLYVAIQQLLNLEKEVITYAARADIAVDLIPQVRPTQLHGIEINPYAAELAQIAIWIGYLQWMRENGFKTPSDPILEPIRTIECRDAILDLSNPDKPKRAPWPDAHFIIGNPPFLGGSLIWEAFGTTYRDNLWATYGLPGFSDLCCYWVDLARRAIERSDKVRAGLLATQAIRGGVNRGVLRSVKQAGEIFAAWSDRNWILDGAAVHVSIICFHSSREPTCYLDGVRVAEVFSDLTADLNLTNASRLQQNEGMAYSGSKKGGAFDIDFSDARAFCMAGGNPHGHSNYEVLRPWVNGSALTRRWRGKWIIDFGTDCSEQEASLYELPFEYVVQNIRPTRKKNKRKVRRENWWLHAERVSGLRDAMTSLTQYLATARVSKHRIFSWVAPAFLPDDGVFVFVRSDDYFFGVLHGSIHELWARRMGTQLREVESGFRYTPTTCLETFPFPWAPGEEPVAQPPSAGSDGLSETHPRAGVPQLNVPQVDVPRVAKEAKSHYRRNLPHIQPGDRPVFVTFCTRDRWVLPESARTIVMEHCLRDHGTKIQVHGLVVMPDHVHIVLTPLPDSGGVPYGLAEIMNGIKGASAHRINKALKRRGSVWQDESFDHILRRSEALEEKIDYVCHNPVRKGLVKSENDYEWLWREWVDDVAQPPSAGSYRPSEPHPGAGVPHTDVPHRLHTRISEAAAVLNEQRERWLNPPEWIEPIAQAVDAEDDFADVPEDARALIRESAIMAQAAKDPNLKRRTLTNLYNERPTWLRLAHEKLDRAVLAAYAAVDPDGGWDEAWAEVWVDTGAGRPLPEGHELIDRRAQIEERVLANLLRLNLARACQVHA